MNAAGNKVLMMMFAIKGVDDEMDEVLTEAFEALRKHDRAGYDRLMKRYDDLAEIRSYYKDLMREEQVD